MRIKKPWSFLASSGLYKHKFNDNFEAFIDEFNGNIDNTNIKTGAVIDASKFLDASIPGSKILARQLGEAAMDYTSLRVIRVGPTFSTSPNGVMKVSGRNEIILPFGTTRLRIWTPFASYAAEGNPRFFSAPRITYGGIEVPSNVIGVYRVWTDLILATGFVCVIDSTVAGAPTTLHLHWSASGRV